MNAYVFANNNLINNNMSVNTIPEVSHDETNTSVTRIGCNIVRTQFIHKALQLA